jgi:hypothetical protein
LITSTLILNDYNGVPKDYLARKPKEKKKERQIEEEIEG